MGTRFSFFNLAGYLFPGVIFLTAVGLPLSRIEPVAETLATLRGLLVDAQTTSAAISLALLFAVPATAFVFPIGVFISDTYLMLSAKFLVPKFRLDEISNDEFYAQLEALGADGALQASQLVREVFVLNSVAKWDLYGSAGRTRMLGASGLALVLSATVYVLYLWLLWALVEIFVGALMITIATKQHHVYNRHVIANAFVFRRLLSPGEAIGSPSGDEGRTEV